MRNNSVPVFIIAAILLFSDRAEASFSGGTQANIEASSKLNSYFQNLALKIPRILLARKIEWVGELDLSELQREIKQVHWNLVTNKFVAGSGGRRASAIYIVEKKAVFISRPAWEQISEETRAVASLHEALGALGYKEEEYTMSLGLQLLAQESAAPDFRLDKAQMPWLENFARLQRRIKTPVYFSENEGTISGVGGGGDGYEIKLKILLLNRVRELWKSHQDQITKSDMEKSYTLFLAARIVVDYGMHQDPQGNAHPAKLRVSISGGNLLVHLSVFQILVDSAGLVDKIILQTSQLR